VAAARRCRGLLGDDPELLLAAAEALRAVPAVVERAHTLEDAGAALVRAGRREEAIAAYEEALAVYEHAGAARLAARIHAAVRALGVRRRRPVEARRPRAGWDSLTATELTVARLATEGLTNRQVGERLYVSRRTVETHLAHVFAKLGLSGRAQLAAEVARHPPATG
jgi:DNA-binding CsgD family transcriptional regulator